MESIPHPNDASDEIWLLSASWSRRYSCLKVWTDGRTPTRLPSYKLTLSLRLWWANKNVIIFLSLVWKYIVCFGCSKESSHWNVVFLTVPTTLWFGLFELILYFPVYQYNFQSGQDISWVESVQSSRKGGLLKDTRQCFWWASKQGPLDLKSGKLPSHCTPLTQSLLFRGMCYTQ